MFKLLTIDIQNGIVAQTAVFLLCENQRLQDAGSFDTLPFYTSFTTIDGSHCCKI
jgi:hypothetical protein